MKRTISIIVFTLSCFLLLLSIFLGIYGFYDLNRTLEELANTPGTSGIDYWGVGWGYGICLFVPSVLGLVLSIVSKILQQQKALQYISVCMIFLFVWLTIASICLFFA
ncbi:MAG: hypothetical protein J6A88_10135 [Oscillospiraceae bacterium]|nr:hypothetical protein [Oscillospiraceae bacterium]